VWRYSINSVVGIPLSQMSIEILGLEFGLISIEVLLSIMVHGDSLLHNAQNPNSSSGKTHHKKSYTHRYEFSFIQMSLLDLNIRLIDVLVLIHFQPI
jgi:hypothetical protein